MTKARSELVAVAETPFYHCISRCVRRAFLCGYDAVTGRNLSHRRDWVVRRMRVLSRVFTIDVCAFAIMGNHYHLVLRIDSLRAQRLSAREVAMRWRRLFKGDVAVQRFLEGSELDEAEQQRVRATVGTWRSRLVSLSWYMRALNEHIARRANAEDACKGRFWEGRFKSQALLDDQALLSCMAYVDLNPIRVQMAATPETSAFTSISQRIRDTQSSLTPSSSSTRHAAVRMKARQTACPLMPFAGEGACHNALPFDGNEYMELVDWSGRILRPDKPGSISPGLPPILLRLGIDRIAFARHVASRGSRFARAVGTVEQLRAFAKKCGRCFTKGVGAARALFGSESLRPG
jgi:REP element-mobilizing transposase RayT